MKFCRAILIFSFWAVLGTIAVFADTAEPDALRIRFTSLSRLSGLSSDQILDITQDHSGGIWMVSNDGLNKFDGYEITKIRKESESTGQLSSNRLTSIAAAKRSPGPLWIGTAESGLNRFDPLTRKSEWFRRDMTKGKALLSDAILCLALSKDGKLWIGTDHGLNFIDPANEHIQVATGALEGERISCIAVFPDDQVWIGSEKGRLFRKNTRKSTFEAIWETGAPITSLALNQGEIWIGTDGGGLFHFAEGNGVNPQLSKLEKRDITSLCSDLNGDLWVGTTQGLARLDRDSGDFVTFSHDHSDPDSLVDNHVTKIFQDQSEMLWITTRGGGASRFGLDHYWFPHIRKAGHERRTLPHPSVLSLSSNKSGDSIWIGTEKGIARWNPGAGTLEQPVEDEVVQNSYVISILEDSLNRLWLGTKGNGLILREVDGSIIHFQHTAGQTGGLPHNLVSKVFEDSKGQIWIGTAGGGICKFRSDTGIFETAESEPAFVCDIGEDSGGAIWVAGREGVFVHTPDSATVRSYRDVFPDGNDLPNHSAVTILPDKNGIIWLGTAEYGLTRIDSVNGEIISYRTSNSDLPDDEIRALAKDGSGRLWISTGTGITRFNVSRGEFRSFLPEDGLQRHGFNPNAVAIDQNHTLYFGGPNGFNIIYPNKLPAPAQSPIPILTGLEFFGKKVSPGKGEILEKHINQTNEIVIPFDSRNQFAIKFANLDSRYPSRGVFRYMLSDYNLTWQMATRDRRAQYSSLPPGNYRFKVQSSPDGRKWPDNAAQIAIVISPPWWQRWWFRFLVLVTLILGTVFASQFVIRSRMKQIERREEAFKAQRDHAEAALARQLQHSMLIERAAREFQEGMKGNQILSDSMKNFAAQFGASHCFILQLVEDNSGSRNLSLVGYFSEAGQSSPEEFQIDANLPFSIKTLETEEAVLFEDFNEIPKRLQAFFDASGKSALLAVRTTFLDQTNGLIILQRTQNDRSWSLEKIKLLQTLSPQFGIAIAQINTARKEEEYREHLKEARHEAEVANRAKSDFLAKMTHELRTPLNAIIGFTEIIQEDTTLSKTQRNLVNIVNTSGEHLHDVINDILDLSKIEAGKLEKNDEIFELTPLLNSVREMLQMRATEKGIDFQFQALSALPGQIETDRSKLRQTLINLINNAIKFTDNGSVTLKVGASSLSKPIKKEGKLRRKVRIDFDISDTGRGIAKTDIAGLFEKYSQAESSRHSSEDGTGLGLPIARSFVQLLGGDIQVKSDPGRGSSFRYYIKCDEIATDTNNKEAISIALSEAKAQKINGFRSDLEEIRILIVEDQPTNRLLLQKILGKAGFKIKEATNGKEAIEIWKNWHPHLILMDEDMPVMRGSEATKLIKAAVSNSSEIDPVIVSLTAYALDQAKQSAFEAGVQDFVAKPFRSNELFSVISRHLGVDYTFTDAA